MSDGREVVYVQQATVHFTETTLPRIYELKYIGRENYRGSSEFHHISDRVTMNRRNRSWGILCGMISPET